jgi:hypothetical protein
MNVLPPAFPTKKIEFAKGKENDGCPGKQGNETQGAPENHVTGWCVSDHGIIGEIICVRKCFARAIRRGSPGRPGEKGGQLLEFLRVLNMFVQQTTIQ